MSSAYFAPLVLLATVIDSAGQYRTRSGDVVTINSFTARHSFGCGGSYASGIAERWHKSGRILASRETVNDIIEKVI